jgi:hypothetical protein
LVAGGRRPEAIRQDARLTRVKRLSSVRARRSRLPSASANVGAASGNDGSRRGGRHGSLYFCRFRRPLRAVIVISRSQRNAGFRSDSGPSRGRPCRRGLRPIEASGPRSATGALRRFADIQIAREERAQSAPAFTEPLSIGTRMRYHDTAQGWSGRSVALSSCQSAEATRTAAFSSINL